jgi:hypothetical protein
MSQMLSVSVSLFLKITPQYPVIDLDVLDLEHDSKRLVVVVI